MWLLVFDAVSVFSFGLVCFMLLLQGFRNGRKTRLCVMNNLGLGKAGMGMSVQTMKMLCLLLRQSQD